MQQLKVAMIGCGRIAHKHVEALLNNVQGVVLHTACDVVASLAEGIARQYTGGLAAAGLPVSAVPSCTDYRQLVGNPDIQAVVIATESGKHAEIALAFLQAGKHVLVEKPMALSTADADAMMAMAAKHKVTLCVSHQNRFNPAVRKLREAVEAGRFGRLVAGNARILWNRNQGYYTQAPWRGTYEQDGGCLMNQCIHNIDLLQWMLGGEPQTVQAMLGNYLHPYIEAEDYGSIQIRFAGGAIGNVEGTVCVYPQNLEETLTLIGEKGTVVIGGVALNKVQVWQFADNLDTLAAVQRECNNEVDSVYGRGHTPLYADWIEAIETGRQPLIDGVEGKKAMSIILHAYEAEQLGGRVPYGRSQLQSIDYRK